jgi:hypothetical protein
MSATPITLTREELEELLAVAAARGAREAIVGLLGVSEGDKNIARDFQNLRELLSTYKVVQRGVLMTIGKILAMGLVLLCAMVISKATNFWSFFPH